MAAGPLVRAPNHLGDFVMALPALYAVKPRAVLVRRWLAPLAELAGFTTIPCDRGTRGLIDAALAIRRRGCARGILLTPSFSSALMLRLGGVASCRGTDTDGRGLLLTARIAAALLANTHRAAAYMIIATGDQTAGTPVPRLPVPPETRAAFRALVGHNDPIIGVCPGSNAPARTWPAERFRAVVQQLAAAGRKVIVFGAAAERAQTAFAAGAAALDLGGRTDLPMLAAGLAGCDVVLSTDSGPLDLAAAVATATVSIWGAGDPARTGPPAGHKILRAEPLPCLECVKNICPRAGQGFFLPEAHMECMQLVTVESVAAAVSA